MDGAGESAMSWEQPLKEREKALEEDYIHRHEAALRERNRATRERRDEIEALSHVSGIDDETLLDDLVSHGIVARTAAAFDLLPMVLVAWAEGTPNATQRDEIRREALRRGLGRNGPGPSLLEGWLEADPAPRLRALWVHYTRARCARLRGAERDWMRDALLEPARALARHGRGLLSLGFGVSRAAAAALAELDDAFRAAPD